MTGVMVMTSLNAREWVIGAVFLALAGPVLAEGPIGGVPEVVAFANIVPLLPEAVTEIPPARQYLYRYAMEYSAPAPEPMQALLHDYYVTSTILQRHQYQPTAAALNPEPLPKAPAAHYLAVLPSAVPDIQLIQIPDQSSVFNSPQRRLSVTINDWNFSGTARLSILHASSTGASLTVRHKF